MPKVKLPYSTENNIRELITKRQGELMAQTGESHSQKDIMIHLADACEVSLESIKSIMKQNSQPSLPLAMAIADYFNVSIEEIFKLVRHQPIDENQ